MAFNATPRAVAATAAAVDVVAIVVLATDCTSRDVAAAFAEPPNVVFATDCASVVAIVAFVEVPNATFVVACVFAAVLAAFEVDAFFSFAIEMASSPAAA